MSWNYFMHDDKYSVFGLDGSTWQINQTDPNVDWDLLVSRVGYVFWRALLGKWPDPTFDYVVKSLKPYNMPMGYYQLLHVRASSTNMKAQFAALRNVVATYGMPALGIVLDCETNPDNLTKQQYGDQLAKFLKWCYEEWGEENITIYTRTSWWDWTLGGYKTDYPKRAKLWIARYKESIPVPTDQYYGLPKDWKDIANPKYINKWSHWQNSADGNLLAPSFGLYDCKSIDLNRFFGNAEQFKRLYGVYPNEITNPLGGVVTDPPDDGEIEPIVSIKEVQVTASALNTRNKPNGVDLGQLIRNSVVPVTEEEGDWLKIEAWIHGGYVIEV
jgi:hypothetical protein